MEIIKDYLGELIILVNEMSPYLLLGFLFAGLLRVFFPRRYISRYMGQHNLRSVVNASLLGVPMPLCSCGVLPAGIGFYRNGARRGSTISFLISTPQTGVDSILATYGLLGLPLAIIRPVVALVTGVVGGVMGNLADRKEVVAEPEPKEADREHERSVKEFFRYGFVELIQDISKWLILGMLVAALLSVLVPDDFFTRNIRNEYLAMFMMLLASVPLYVCATGSIPIAAVLMMKGLSPGAALVLLIINGYVMKFISKRKERRNEQSSMEKIRSKMHIFRVEGMTCNHCKANVENGLKSNPLIAEAQADPSRNLVTVRAENLRESEVRNTIESLGYRYLGRMDER